MVRLFDTSAQALNNICHSSSKKIRVLLNIASIIITSLSPHAKLVVTFYVVSCDRGLVTAQDSRRNVVLSCQVFQRVEFTLRFAHPALQNLDCCFGCNADVLFR